jgi:hypothetical protein
MFQRQLQIPKQLGAEHLPAKVSLFKIAALQFN